MDHEPPREFWDRGGLARDFSVPFEDEPDPDDIEIVRQVIEKWPHTGDLNLRLRATLARHIVAALAAAGRLRNM